jgi:quercetin dioxygenase-like cupin family protein/uncharacterized protein YndB with AHSA1/START domain
MNAHQETLQIPELGLAIELISKSPEQLVIEVTGRPRGFLRQAHIHTDQTERHEVLEGQLKLVIDGKDHLLSAGDALEVPPGTSHRQLPAGEGDGRVRITISPAGTTWHFLRRLAKMSAEKQFNRWGFPKPVAGAELFNDYGAEGRASRPPYAIQRALSTGLLLSGAITRHAWRKYVFVDEWDVAAPPEAVFDALADGRTYPEWWTPVYIGVDSDGPPAVGHSSTQHFKGRLPYHLHTKSTTVEINRPQSVTGVVEGDLSGRGTWTVTPTEDGSHVRFDWEVFADRLLLRVLTPLLRPVFRWNHNWAIERAMAGLEPYAQSTAASGKRDKQLADVA